jgi:hypothetical protein
MYYFIIDTNLAPWLSLLEVNSIRHFLKSGVTMNEIIAPTRFELQQRLASIIETKTKLRGFRPQANYTASLV